MFTLPPLFTSHLQMLQVLRNGESIRKNGKKLGCIQEKSRRVPPINTSDHLSKLPSNTKQNPLLANTFRYKSLLFFSKGEEFPSSPWLTLRGRIREGKE